MTKQINITYLLGSGISSPAGMPSVKELTDTVLKDRKIFRHTDGCYYFNNSSNFPDFYPKHVEFIQLFLEEIKRVICTHHKHYSIPIDSVNYEDLAYICSQLHDNEFGEYENPAVFPLSMQIRDFLEANLQIFRNENRNEEIKWDVGDVFYEAENYIRDVIWRSLCIPRKSIEYLKTISNGCFDKSVAHHNIFTLNHDTILEDHLRNADIQFSSGFGDPINGISYWDASILEKSQKRVNLVKLHGSLNWFNFQPNTPLSQTRKIGIPDDWDYQHTLNPDGVKQYPVSFHPIFLAGTFNKIMQYSNGIFADLFTFFRKSLRDSNVVIICGYGFGDKGINNHLIEWINESRENRIILIHEKPEELFLWARNAIKKREYEWQNEGKLQIIHKFIQDTNWEEIKNSLN